MCTGRRGGGGEKERNTKRVTNGKKDYEKRRELRIQTQRERKKQKNQWKEVRKVERKDKKRRYKIRRK